MAESEGHPEIQPSTSASQEGQQPEKSSFRNLLQKYSGIPVTPGKLSELMNASDSEDERIIASEIE